MELIGLLELADVANGLVNFGFRNSGIVREQGVIL